MIGTSHNIKWVRSILPIILILNSCAIFSQHADHDHQHDHDHDHEYFDIYKLEWDQESAILGIGLAMNIMGRVVINKADPATLEEISQLSKDDLLFIDRGAVDNYSSTAETISDIILYTSATLPFLTYSQKHCREEVAQIAIMGIETFLLTNGITNITKGAFKRYRPFNYNPDVPEDIKLSTNSRVSFFSGHASTTAAMSFFAAKVMTDTHPDMKNKWIIWTTAAVLPATVSYLRFLAGKHFPTDIITGYAVGAGIGLMIPKIHMKKNVSITPTIPGGMILQIRF